MPWFMHWISMVCFVSLYFPQKDITLWFHSVASTTQMTSISVLIILFHHIQGLFKETAWRQGLFMSIHTTLSSCGNSGVCYV